MGFKCIVKNCNRLQAGGIMHSLPKDPKMFDAWMKKILRTDINISKRLSYRVCDAHFSQNMKFMTVRKRSNLKVDAVPDLHIPDNITRNAIDALPPVGSVQNFCPESVTSAGYIPPTHMLMSEGKRKRSYSVSIASSHRKKPQRTENSTKTPTCRADIRQKVNLLKQTNVGRTAHLSPKAFRYYRIAKGMLQTARQLDFENTSNRKRLEEALKVAESAEHFQGKLNPRTLRFVQCQIQQQTRKLRGRRFTLDDKIFGLSLLKTSPKGYRMLQKTFALPSRRTLSRLLAQLPFTCGINDRIMENLRISVKQMEASDKYCTLVFDEMSLEAGLSYSEAQDSICGFEDNGTSRNLKFADHAMVVMLRGIRKKWKQPLCFYFSESGMSTTEVAFTVIQKSIAAAQNIGLVVVATVCDQLSVNSAAIKMLMSETERKALRQQTENRMFGFSVGASEIIPIYDPPHLIKGLRNNFLHGRVKFTWKKSEQIASWNDVVSLYELDVGDHDTRMLNKLTDAHIYEEKMKKMKVNLAAQIFSQRVSSTMRGLVKFGRGCLPDSALDTADFLLFCDKVFDSVNGISLLPTNGKDLRCSVTTTSKHVTFWYEAIQVFESMKFISDKEKEFVPPTIKNWIKSLRGMIYLWEKLEKEQFQFLCPRNLNQDAIENFFGCVRSHGCRNINPTCSAFQASFKTLIINNFLSPHSPGANCEEDESEGALSSLTELLNNDNLGVQPLPEVNTDLFDAGFKIKENTNPVVFQTHAYLAGYFAKQIFKDIGTCNTCIQQLNASRSEHYELIECRAYTPKALVRPDSNFLSLYRKCNEIMHHYLPNICNKSYVHANLVSITKLYFGEEYVQNCGEHNLLDIFIKKFAHFYILTWIKNVNRTLKGLENRVSQNNDHVKRLAYDKYRKYKHKKNKVKLMKQLA